MAVLNCALGKYKRVVSHRIVLNTLMFQGTHSFFKKRIGIALNLRDGSIVHLFNGSFWQFCAKKSNRACNRKFTEAFKELTVKSCLYTVRIKDWKNINSLNAANGLGTNTKSLRRRLTYFRRNQNQLLRSKPSVHFIVIMSFENKRCGVDLDP